MESTLKYIATGIAVIVATAAVVLVVINKNDEIKSLKTQLDMMDAESGALKQSIKQEREYNQKFGEIVFTLRDSVEILQNKSTEQSDIITQLNKQKNEIKKTGYSNRSDDELSIMLQQLFSEQDSMP